MLYTFNREGKGPNDWSKNNAALEHTLKVIREDSCLENEMKDFLLRSANDATMNKDQEIAFWAYADAVSMPADVRCEYFYKPTYLMTLCIVNIINKMPELMKFAGVNKTLRYALNACTGRNLQGNGYDAYEGLCNNVLFFMRNGIIPFLKGWPLFSIQFERTFRNALNRIEQDYNAGIYTGDCWGKNCKDIQKTIIQLRNNPVIK